MSEELPALWALDMAAKAAGYADWLDAPDIGNASTSIIAHARTLEKLAKYEPEIVPVDPDGEALSALMNAWFGSPYIKSTASEWAKLHPVKWKAALAELKRIKRGEG